MRLSLLQKYVVSLEHLDDVGSDLSNEGGLLGGDPGLCGAVMDFLSELGGGGFGLDEGGGSFVAAT